MLELSIWETITKRHESNFQITKLINGSRMSTILPNFLEVCKRKTLVQRKKHLKF
jgi:hypothetical protein